ncbi:alpha/beta hydrolase family protein [Jatrophihabitans lederbergiae]|uniref:Alpha/beta family hydrolase n=1 Tax=Jatrophihabitans lederbergiae TaxID=3075547 RepID=A0ABU2JBM6_9ACTN|nr:alpha/beta family hydrolase [Jatrophihabitans sp. DSM 44399]MDT0262394.1 alpha/beta family hydrolase [Jatrophihabitans sp. DSM 44399]
MRRLMIATPAGDAGVDLDLAPGASTLLVLGHGAGGSVEAPDLLAVRDACVSAGISVARVTQPYRVAGKKAPPAAATLDIGWAAVVAALGRRKALATLAFIFAGRSSGARVACRAAVDESVSPTATAVVALAFPVHPPGKPEKSRLGELDAVRVPVLVVQGDRDPFGMPEPRPEDEQRAVRLVCEVPGDHSLKRNPAQIGELVAGWLAVLPPPRPDAPHALVSGGPG